MGGKGTLPGVGKRIDLGSNHLLWGKRTNYVRLVHESHFGRDWKNVADLAGLSKTIGGSGEMEEDKGESIKGRGESQ